jgi:hypothetical protein
LPFLPLGIRTFLAFAACATDFLSAFEPNRLGNGGSMAEIKVWAIRESEERGVDWDWVLRGIALDGNRVWHGVALDRAQGELVLALQHMNKWKQQEEGTYPRREGMLDR